MVKIFLKLIFDKKLGNQLEKFHSMTSSIFCILQRKLENIIVDLILKKNETFLKIFKHSVLVWKWWWRKKKCIIKSLTNSRTSLFFFLFNSQIARRRGKGIFFLALTSWVSRKTEKELKCKIPTCFTENLSLQTRLIAEVKH